VGSYSSPSTDSGAAGDHFGVAVAKQETNLCRAVSDYAGMTAFAAFALGPYQRVVTQLCDVHSAYS